MTLLVVVSGITAVLTAIVVGLVVQRRAAKRLATLEMELEATRKELTDFLYSVSHDLRAPLRTIEGFAEALAEDYREQLDEQGLDHVNTVRGAARRMDAQIVGLLELSRLARTELVRQRVDLSAIAQSIAGQLKKSDPSRAVEFLIAPDVIVEGDAKLLETALEHLLKNAWKFTGRHPSAKIEFGTEKIEGRRILYLRDDGAGFDPAYAGRMFTLFQRLHSSSEFDGIGAGLAIVRLIVRRHSGKVWAAGAVEAGTTIYMELG